MTMTPKQRVMAAVDHREPDRIPLDIGGSAVTSIHYRAYNDLMAYVGRPHAVRDRHHTEFMDLAQSIVQVDEDFVRRFQVDCQGLTPGSHKLRWDDAVECRDDGFVMSDRFGGRWFCPLDGYYFDQRADGFPMAGFESVAEVERFAWPPAIDDRALDDLRNALRAMGDQHAVLIGEPIGGIFNTGFKLRGYGTFFLDLVEHPALAECIMATLTDIKTTYWEKVLSAVGDLVDIIVLEDDLGHQDRTMIAPAMYRDLIKPHHRRLVAFIRQKAPDHVRVMLHSCGSVYRLMADFIDVGFDILNPIQTTAAEMEPARLKREFGSDLAFWGGGIDIQKVLPFAEPAAVADEVQRRIDELAPGGGFVFAATHNIQPLTPPRNIMTMWEVFQRHCTY